MTRDHRRTLLALLAVVGLLLTACGGDDGDDTADDGDATTTTAADDTDDGTDETTGDDGDDGDDTDDAATDGTDDTDADEGDDADEGGDGDGRPAAEAEALVVDAHPTLDDFPDGYQATDEVSDGADTLTDCFTTVDEDQQLAQSTATRFEAPSGAASNVTTVVYDSVATAEAALAELLTDEFVACAETYIDDGFGATDGTTLEASADEPPIGEESVSVSGAFVANDAAAGISLHAVRTADVVSLLAILDINGTSAIEGAVAEALTAVGSRHTVVG